MFQLITMAEDIKLCSKCKPGKPEGKLSTTSLVYVPAQMKVSVCGSLYNCHCGKLYARLIQQPGIRQVQNCPIDDIFIVSLLHLMHLIF